MKQPAATPSPAAAPPSAAADPSPAAAPPPADAAPAPPATPGFATVKLSRPLTAIDRILTELSFREPTGADICDIGFPQRGGGGVDGALMTAFIARLAGIPLTSARALSAADWTKCTNAISDFFVPTAEPSSS